MSLVHSETLLTQEIVSDIWYLLWTDAVKVSVAMNMVHYKKFPIGLMQVLSAI